MNKQIRFWLSLLFLLLVGLPILPAVAAETSTIYTIKPGDSLWGISERFIKDPYYWPSLWANNPDITNPHLIYPGQKVRLYNGRIELVPEYPGEQQPTPAREEKLPAVIEDSAPPSAKPILITAPQEPLRLFKTSGSGDGFIKTDEKLLGSLVDSVDSRVLLTENDLVFLNMKNPAQVKVGDTYSLFDSGPKVKHPLTGKNFGTMMYDLGFVQIIKVTDTAIVGKIGSVYREIERGAQLFEYIDPPQSIELKKASGDLAGHIIAGKQHKQTQGENDIIYIDLGLNNGLQVGNILYISRPRQATELSDKKRLKLPDNLLGAAVVVETRNQSAAAMIFKSVTEMRIGDQVMAAAE